MFARVCACIQLRENREETKNSRNLHYQRSHRKQSRALVGWRVRRCPKKESEELLPGLRGAEQSHASYTQQSSQPNRRPNSYSPQASCFPPSLTAFPLPLACAANVLSLSPASNRGVLGRYRRRQGHIRNPARKGHICIRAVKR